MSKAEKRMYECFPNEDTNSRIVRFGFSIGYHQAENDLELTWEDIRTIDQLLWDLSPEWSGKKDNEGYFKEVLKRFKAQKGEEV